MLAQFEEDYLSLIVKILNEGEFRETRNAPTLAIFGEKLVFKPTHLNEVPLLRGRRIYYGGILGELKTMLEGPKNGEFFWAKEFQANGCNYWDQWADEYGRLKLDYGTSWLDWNGVNQIEEVKKSIIEDPTSRRHIITGWRPDAIAGLSLPCCHMLYQWYVTNNGTLDMIWYQRSVDTMVGLPSDILFAAAWNRQMAFDCELVPGKITFMLGDTHIYQSHLPQVVKYLQQSADHRTSEIDSPRFDESVDDKPVINYNPQPAIKFEVHS